MLKRPWVHLSPGLLQTHPKNLLPDIEKNTYQLINLRVLYQMGWNLACRRSVPRSVFRYTKLDQTHFTMAKTPFQSRFTLLLKVLKSKFFPAKFPISKIQKKNLAGKKYFEWILLCKEVRSFHYGPKSQFYWKFLTYVIDGSISPRSLKTSIGDMQYWIQWSLDYYDTNNLRLFYKHSIMVKFDD